MKPKPTLSDSEQVSQHIQKLPKDLQVPVELLRKIILASDKEIGERIKWNTRVFILRVK